MVVRVDGCLVDGCLLTLGGHGGQGGQSGHSGWGGWDGRGGQGKGYFVLNSKVAVSGS